MNLTQIQEEIDAEIAYLKSKLEKLEQIKEEIPYERGNAAERSAVRKLSSKYKEIRMILGDF